MIFAGQDKGQGPKRPKPLSAHRFFWPTHYSWWAKDSARLPLLHKKSAGPKRDLAKNGSFTGVL